MKLAGRSTVRFYRKHPDFAVKLNLGMTPVSLGLHCVADPYAVSARILRQTRGANRSSRAISSSNTITSPASKRHWERGKKAIDRTRKVSCGALRAADETVNVELNGWVNRRRDHGGLIFVDLRDRDGITQVVFDPQDAELPRCRAPASRRRSARARHRAPPPAGHRKPAARQPATSRSRVDELEILNRSQVPPFSVNSDDDVDENLRLEYRYLDLRRPRMQRNLRTRHRIVKAMRDFFDARGFVEIETPMLIKSTPEGARDYLVPSRLHPGAFYALPQSPQMLKQILMVAGLRALHANRALHARRGFAGRPAAGVHPNRRRDVVLHRRTKCSRRWNRASATCGSAALGVGLAAVPALDARGGDRASTASTSPTCASGSSSPTSATLSPVRSSPFSPSARRPAARSSRCGIPAVRRCRVATSTR